MLKEWLVLKKMCQMGVHRFRTPAAAASRPALRVLKSIVSNKGKITGSAAASRPALRVLKFDAKGVSLPASGERQRLDPL